MSIILKVSSNNITLILHLIESNFSYVTTETNLLLITGKENITLQITKLPQL